ncbi:MAG TPA: hypothetical protein VD928_03605, partial [Candidatus Paceibacterota bacterium]|nr:hypothetical protein [Candidatus Paceibacterota bacterium]
DLQIPSYERRTALMNNKALMSGYVYLTQAYRYDDCELVLSQYEKISGREDFETQMPPFLKLASHYIAAKCQLKAGDMAVAEALTMKAEALNGNLNAAWGEWQGVELLSNVSGKEGTFPYTYVLLGDISAKKGDSVKAREYYTIAQAIAPNDARINATMNTYVEE